MSDEPIVTPGGVCGPSTTRYSLADSLPPIGVPPAEVELSRLIRKRRDKAAQLRARADAFDTLADELSIALDRMKADPNRKAGARGGIKIYPTPSSEDLGAHYADVQFADRPPLTEKDAEAVSELLKEEK